MRGMMNDVSASLFPRCGLQANLLFFHNKYQPGSFEHSYFVLVFPLQVALWLFNCPPRSLDQTPGRRRLDSSSDSSSSGGSSSTGSVAGIGGGFVSGSSLDRMRGRAEGGRLRRRLQGSTALNPQGMMCNIVATKAWGHWFATIPFPDGSYFNVGFRSLTYARNALTDADGWWPSLVLEGKEPPQDGGKVYAPGTLTVVASAGMYMQHSRSFRGKRSFAVFMRTLLTLLRYLSVMFANCRSLEPALRRAVRQPRPSKRGSNSRQLFI